jgi:hypothetical protein
MTEEQKDQMRIAINRKVEQHWDKLVKDSKQVSGYNYKNYGQDLLMFCISEFLTKKDLEYQYKVAVTDDKLPNYLGRAMSLNIRSSNSPFYSKYRKHMMNNRGLYEAEYDNTVYKTVDYQPDEPDYGFDLEKKHKSPVDCMEWAVSQLDFYYGALVNKYYYQKYTIKEIAEYYEIPKDTIQQDLKKARKILRQHCNHFDI